METARPQRAGVLVVRVWMEAGSQQPRVRVVAKVDVDGGRELTYAASSVDEICARIRDWMAEFLADPPAP
jgi:hypothetical protein